MQTTADDEAEDNSINSAISTHLYKAAYVVEDVDECTLPSDNIWHHKCGKGSVCVNTVGSYECI